MHAAEVADALGTAEVLVPPFPGITAATGLLTSDLKYDQMRTVFMVEGAVDAAVIDAALDEISRRASSSGWPMTGSPSPTSASPPALDCRYVGQGYELRVALPEGRFTEAAFESSVSCTSRSTATRSRARSRS